MRRYRDHCISIGHKKKTLVTRLQNLSTMQRLYCREHELPYVDVFKGVSLKAAEDNSDREKVTPEENIKAMLGEQSQLNNTEKAVVRILKDTGMRISELTHTARNQVHLDTNIPYLEIRPNKVRKVGNGIKNASSVRDIPLTGDALEAVRWLYKQSEGSEWLIEQYATANDSRASVYLSAKLRTMRKKGIIKNNVRNVHGLRHRMQTRLREIDTPYAVSNAIMGRAEVGSSGIYGDAVGLDKTSDWLERANSR